MKNHVYHAVPTVSVEQTMHQKVLSMCHQLTPFLNRCNKGPFFGNGKTGIHNQNRRKLKSVWPAGNLSATQFFA